MTFKEFVQGRMEPFEAMQLPYGMNLDSILRANLNWLIESAGVPPEMTRQHAQAWLKVEGAQRVKAVCDELQTFLDVPLLPTVKAVWHRLYPKADAARLACERCGGSGWISVNGPHGTSAAYPCTHQPETESDRRMGVRIPPAVATHYRQLDIEAEGRKAVCEGQGGNHSVDDFKRANSRTVAGIAAGRF